MILKRKIYDKLVEWKRESNGTTALLIGGARRVGKSFVAKEFGENEYKSYILIDFAVAPQEIKDLFVYDTGDLELFFQKLSLYYSVTLYTLRSCVDFRVGFLLLYIRHIYVCFRNGIRHRCKLERNVLLKCRLICCAACYKFRKYIRQTA